MNTQCAKIMSELVLSDKTVRIKLLGDSITHGVGGSGFKQDGEPIVEHYARNTSGYCWAKLFKEHFESQYNCKVINNACTGTTIQFIISNFDKLVDAEDDIVICTIGTNNRHQYFNSGEKCDKREYMEQFYNNIVKLHGMLEKAGKRVIFVANIPASAKNECDGENYWRIFHMNDVNDLYMKASCALGFPFISLYNLFSEYCELNGISVDSLLRDGLHPNDEGYEVMFGLIIRELGLGKRIY